MLDSRLRAIASMANVLESQNPDGVSPEERAVGEAANGSLPTISVFAHGQWLMRDPVGERAFLQAVRHAANTTFPLATPALTSSAARCSATPDLPKRTWRRR